MQANLLLSAQERNADIIALEAGGIVSHAERVICCCSIHIYTKTKVCAFFLCYLLFMPYRTSVRTSFNLLQLSLQHLYSLNGPLAARMNGACNLKFSFNSQDKHIYFRWKLKTKKLGAS